MAAQHAAVFAHHVDRAAADAVLRSVLSPPSPRGAMERALAARLGLADVDAAVFSQALTHPLLPDWDGCRSHSREADTRAFEGMRSEGAAAIDVFAKEYVRARFPRLLPDDRARALATYTAPQCLAAVARAAGVEAGIVPFCGTPQIEQPLLDAFVNGRVFRPRDTAGVISQSALSKGGQSSELHSSRDVLADIFLSIAGLALRHAGAQSTRRLLDGRLFAVSFDVRLLCSPARPVLQLHRSLVSLSRRPGRRHAAPEKGGASAADFFAVHRRVDYRLMAESGRTSAHSVYVVGAYIGDQLLSSAHGPSLVDARERAALEALRRIHLIDRPEAPRPSDAIGDDVRTAEALGAFVAERSGLFASSCD